MLRVNEEAFKKLKKKGKIALCVGIAAVMLTGCSTREVATNAHVNYDVIDTMDNAIARNGIQQVLDVPGEDFKLVVNYRCLLDGSKWTVTSDKELYIDACTDGLQYGEYVYIDNVHIDTTIRSVYPSVDGITQDTMDDRIHNAQLIGFPIDDANFYSNVNVIEGQNQTFIQGAIYGFNGYTSGSVHEKRFVESDYLNAGVYANKINAIFDLIIFKNDGSTKCVSVPSTIGVSVWPYVERIKRNGESVFDYYYYNEKNGKVETRELSADEYARITEHSMGLGK